VEEYLDEWFPRAAIHSRWNDPETALAASQALAREVMPWAPGLVQHQLAKKIAAWGKRACRALALDSPKQREFVEGEFSRVFDELDRQLAQTRFALGQRPSAVDAALLGGLRGHFLVDPYPARLMLRWPRIATWAADSWSWDGSGVLPLFPEVTPFARFIVAEAAGAFAAFLAANRSACAERQKAFFLHQAGEEVSFLCRPSPDRSRRLLADFIRFQLNDGDQGVARNWLADHGLALFDAP
jgi:hypothetical protein